MRLQLELNQYIPIIRAIVRVDSTSELACFARNNRYRAHFAAPTTTARVSFLPGFHSSKRTPITAEKGSTMIFAKKIASKFTHQRT